MALGVAENDGHMIPRDPVQAGKLFAHACELKLSSGCSGILQVVSENNGAFFQNACEHGDGESCFLLGSLYFAGQGVPREPSRAFALLQQSCSDGWMRGCSGLAECYRAGAGTPVDNFKAIAEFDNGCKGGIASSCFSASAMYRGMNDSAAAQNRLREGCQIHISFAESSAAYFERGSPAQVPIPAICSSIAK